MTTLLALNFKKSSFFVGISNIFLEWLGLAPKSPVLFFGVWTNG